MEYDGLPQIGQEGRGGATIMGLCDSRPLVGWVMFLVSQASHAISNAIPARQPRKDRITPVASNNPQNHPVMETEVPPDA
jgi:hypothetical protein